jgi:hypothetical protein
MSMNLVFEREEVAVSVSAPYQPREREHVLRKSCQLMVPGVADTLT